MKTLRSIITVFGCALFVVIGTAPALIAEGEADHQPAITCDETSLYCPTLSANELPKRLSTFPAPEVTAPVAPIVTPPITVRNPITRTVTYEVTTRGNITSDLATFKTQVQQTFDDNRGWNRLGVQFKAVASGGDFSVVLTEAAEVPSFWSGCSADYSCTVGRYVIINQDRWEGATTSWNNAGGDLRNYRHMVVNHETGHWLGHGHESCPAAGQAAAVMQQQSIDLGGCKFNPWPIDKEIWSSRLGI